MPKKHKDYSERQSLMVPSGMGAEVIAMAYFKHFAGEFSLMARHYIERGLEEDKKEMTPKQKKEYEEILANVKIRISQELERRKARRAP